MAIRPVMRNLLTGKPVKPPVDVKLDRAPSRQGVIVSGVRGTTDFNQMKKTRTDLSPEMLGDGAIKVPVSLGKMVNVTA